MKQDEVHILHAIHLEGDSKVATLLDLAFARIEELERESRRHTQVIGGLVEHEQARDGSIESLRSVVDGVTKVTGRIIDVLEVATDPRNARVNPVFAGTLVSFSPLVPSEPRD